MRRPKPAKVANTEWMMCICGKRAYASRSTAKKVARLLARRTGQKLGGLGAYPCEFSLTETFHVGHPR